MEGYWEMFCGKSGTSPQESDSTASSCTSQALVICFDVLLLVLLLFNFIPPSSSSKMQRVGFRGIPKLGILSALFNGCLGLVYLCLGVWDLEEKLPMKLWLPLFFQALTWSLMGLLISLFGASLPRFRIRLLSISTLLFSGIVCGMSVFAAILNKRIDVKITADVLTFPAALMLILCAYNKAHSSSDEEIESENGSLYTPLNGESNGISDEKHEKATPFSKAGILGTLSFWWLNPLMRLGREKTLEEEDIPNLRQADRAETCYMVFQEQLRKEEKQSQPSLLWTIVRCHSRDIFISGFFAFLKIVTASAGPLLLNAFILVAEGNASFQYEGYLLALTLFFSKSLESLSQRQWYFRSRLIGLKIRSLLTAAIESASSPFGFTRHGRQACSFAFR